MGRFLLLWRIRKRLIWFTKNAVPGWEVWCGWRGERGARVEKEWEKRECKMTVPAFTRRLTIVVLMFGQHRKWWPNTKTTLVQRLVFTEVIPQQTQNICRTFIQRWTSVIDAGPALYTNVLCLLGQDYILNHNVCVNLGWCWVQCIFRSQYLSPLSSWVTCQCIKQFVRD